MCICKHINQRVKRVGKIEWKIFQGCFKNINEKKHEEIEFHYSIQD